MLVKKSLMYLKISKESYKKGQKNFSKGVIIRDGGSTKLSCYQNHTPKKYL